MKKNLANNIHCHSNSHKVISESSSSLTAARWWKHDRRELTKALYAMKYWPEQRALFIEHVYCFNWNQFLWHPVACATLHFCLRAPNQISVLFSHTKRLKSANQMDYCLLSDLDVYVHICAYIHRFLHALGKCTNCNQGWWWRHSHIEPFSWSFIQNIQPDILMHRIEMRIAMQYFNWSTTKTIEFYLFGWAQKKSNKKMFLHFIGCLHKYL